ncbi:MAG: ATP-binding protein [Candidatus Aenigmatarchaeota archaeon]|nr:MAG: ATP-binding protein [Candidatus Aenigmarchaeota archaeon]
MVRKNKDYYGMEGVLNDGCRKIAVMSGKGGVGKTTISVNLAALSSIKHKVALFDADVDCPNVNGFLGIDQRFSVREGKIVPIDKFGMKVVSFASMQENENDPIIWRGPMLSNAIIEMLKKTEWGDLDYIVIDLPPGTSDAPLTIMQAVKPDGVIVVTSPQKASVIDAEKAVNMAKEMGIPVLGIIENMSGKIFGMGGGEKSAKKLGIEFLGRIELDRTITLSCERGVPFVLGDSEQSKFREIVERII